jgi:hypothetical protein
VSGPLEAAQLIVHPEPAEDGFAISYDFALAPARAPAVA